MKSDPLGYISILHLDLRIADNVEQWEKRPVVDRR